MYKMKQNFRKKLNIAILQNLLHNVRFLHEELKFASKDTTVHMSDFMLKVATSDSCSGLFNDDLVTHLIGAISEKLCQHKEAI